MTRHADLPVPVFALGQTVYLASTTNERGTWPCPDCHDAKFLPMTTKAGEEIEVHCPRCNTSGGIRDLPSLNYVKVTASVRKLTIGSIRTNTAPPEIHHSAVEYMCDETGVGSGSVYHEDKLYATREEAEHAAEKLQAASQAKMDELPEAMTAAALGKKPLTVGIKSVWKASIFNAWNEVHSCRETVTQILENASQPGYALGDDARMDLEYLQTLKRYGLPQPLDAFIGVVEGEITKLRESCEWGDELAEETRSALQNGLDTLRATWESTEAGS